jgi:hypothetical protein
MHETNAGDDACTRCLSLVLVVGDEKTDLEKAGVRIEQSRDPLARRELSLLVLTRDLIRSAALA